MHRTAFMMRLHAQGVPATAAQIHNAEKTGKLGTVPRDDLENRIFDESHIVLMRAYVDRMAKLNGRRGRRVCTAPVLN